MSRHLNILLLVVVLLMCVVVYVYITTHVSRKEKFTDIKFAPPGTYPPMNNCYEYAALDRGNGYSLGWNLGDKLWDYVSRAKILSLLVPSTNSMLHTKDTGTLLTGKCVVPKEVEPLLGIDATCKVSNKHQLEKTDDGKCVIDMSSQGDVIPILDDAYEVYDAENLAIIRDLEEQIRFYKEAKESLDTQIPVVKTDINRYNGLMVPLIDHNNTIRTYNTNLENCIKSTIEAKETNIRLLNKIKDDIAATREKNRKVGDMIQAYKPYTNQTAPMPPPPPAPTPPPPPQPTCRNIITDWTNAGAWNITHLDRQPVYCNQDEVLKGFVLETDSRDSIRYKYTCCKLPEGYTHSRENENTIMDINYYHQMEYLDRHNINCGNRFLQGYKVKNDLEYKHFQYEMACDNVGVNNGDKKYVSRNCEDLRTVGKRKDDFNSKRAGTMGYGGTYELAHHSIMCPNGKALTRFQLQRDGKDNNYLYYAYRCCEPGSEDIPKPPPPPPERKFVAAKVSKPNITKTNYGESADFVCPIPIDT